MYKAICCLNQRKIWLRLAERWKLTFVCNHVDVEKTRFRGKQQGERNKKAGANLVVLCDEARFSIVYRRSCQWRSCLSRVRSIGDNCSKLMVVTQQLLSLLNSRRWWEERWQCSSQMRKQSKMCSLFHEEYYYKRQGLVNA